MPRFLVSRGVLALQNLPKPTSLLGAFTLL